MKNTFHQDKQQTSIVHISYDFGDSSKSDKTTAVLNLVNETRRIADVFIADLKRVSSLSEEKISFTGQGHLNLSSFGLPYGIFHTRYLKRTYNKLISAAETYIRSASVIHSHKLTFEGYIGWLISLKYDIPLFITLRQTDFAVLKYRPDLLHRYKEVLQRSVKIFYLVPIMLKLLEERTGTGFFNEHIKNKLVYLPNMVPAPKLYEPPGISGSPLLTILRMTKRSVKRKNLKNLLKAFSLVSIPGIKLKIIGAGDYLKMIEKWIRELNIQDKVIFTGEIPNSEIYRHFAEAMAFVMPSFSESFGLVYAESLLSGTPILYSGGVIGFDGVFKDVGSAVNPYSVDSIKKGIEEIITRNEFYRNRIKWLKKNNAFEIFSADYALKKYSESLYEVTGKEIYQDLHNKNSLTSSAMG